MAHIPINELPWGMRNHDTSKANEARKRKVKAIIGINQSVVYNSIKEASMSTGIHGSRICRCCKGKQGRAAGIRFQYVNYDNE